MMSTSERGDAPAAAAPRRRDARLVAALTAALRGMRDFADKPAAEAAAYAACVVQTVRDGAVDAAECRDQLLGIVANVRSLDGELTAQHITATALATMDVSQMLSAAQRRARRAWARKRAREQVNVDRTRMLCDKCGLVRRDRLNVNEVGLDSEENGTQFDYNFDNTCDCSHSSTDHDDEDESDDEATDVKDDSDTSVQPQAAAAAAATTTTTVSEDTSAVVDEGKQ